MTEELVADTVEQALEEDEEHDDEQAVRANFGRGADYPEAA